MHPWWWPATVSLYAGSLLAAGRPGQAASLLEPLLAPQPGSAPAVSDPAYRARVLGPLAEATGAPQARDEADRLLRAVTAPPGTAWLLGADAYLSTARAWVADGRPERAAELLAPFVAAARRNGWAALVTLADAVTATPLQRR